MAEIVKAKKRQNLVNYEEKEEKVEKKSTKKSPKKEKKTEESKKSVWQHIMIFFNGVKSETKKVRWTSKTDRSATRPAPPPERPAGTARCFQEFFRRCFSFSAAANRL